MTFKTGEKIGLRPVEPEDLDVLSEWENDPEVMLLGNNLTPFSRFFLEQYILGAKNNIYEDKQLRLVIENREKEVVGLIDLFDFDPHHRRAAIGILIGKAHRKKGYASEAMELIIDYGKNTLGLKQLYGTVDDNNQSSKALFLQKGFVLTGKRKQWNLRGREWTDEDFFQLVF